jgi:transketolase
MSISNQLIDELQAKARIIRRHIIEMVAEAGSGHPGGSLSSADIVTALYFHFMNIDPKRPDWPDRDRFVLSKGHAAPVLYAALAEKGYFPKEELLKLRKTGAMLQGHPDMKTTPGLDMTTGSLGQGLSAANGMALAGKLDNKDYRVYVLMGDGEIEEGQIWEAAMAASVYKTDNLCAILDCNGVQATDVIEKVFPIPDLKDKWSAFGWHVIEIDGHNVKEILEALDESKQIKGKPTIIIAHTVKGKGFCFAEGRAKYHNAALSEEEYQQALRIIEQMRKDV